jgi:hypothetical protein
MLCRVDRDAPIAPVAEAILKASITAPNRPNRAQKWGYMWGYGRTYLL